MIVKKILSIERELEAQSRPFKAELAELSMYLGRLRRPPLTRGESPPLQGGVLQIPNLADLIRSLSRQPAGP